eukprot:tig00020563_g11219.t1
MEAELAECRAALNKANAKLAAARDAQTTLVHERDRAVEERDAAFGREVQERTKASQLETALFNMQSMFQRDRNELLAAKDDLQNRIAADATRRPLKSEAGRREGAIAGPASSPACSWRSKSRFDIAIDPDLIPRIAAAEKRAAAAEAEAAQFKANSKIASYFELEEERKEELERAREAKEEAEGELSYAQSRLQELERRARIAERASAVAAAPVGAPRERRPGVPPTGGESEGKGKPDDEAQVQAASLREDKAALLRLAISRLGRKPKAPLRLFVQRGCVFESALAAFSDARPGDRRQFARPFEHALSVRFEGEVGVDQGGPSREFIRLAPGVLPAPLDEEEEGYEEGGVEGGTEENGRPAKRARANPEGAVGPSRPLALRLVGCIQARALAAHILSPDEADPLPAPLAPLVPLLARREPASGPASSWSASRSLEAWAPFLDPAVLRCLRGALAESSSLSDLCLSMGPFLSGHPMYPDPDSPELVLSSENADRLITEAAQWRCVGPRRSALEAVRFGFRETLPLEAELALFPPDELAAIAGAAPRSPAALLASLEFFGWEGMQQDREELESALREALEGGAVDPTSLAVYASGRGSGPLGGNTRGVAFKILPKGGGGALEPEGGGRALELEGGGGALEPEGGGGALEPDGEGGALGREGGGGALELGGGGGAREPEGGGGALALII